jgi:hypothetical protein
MISLWREVRQDKNSVFLSIPKKKGYRETPTFLYAFEKASLLSAIIMKFSIYFCEWCPKIGKKADLMFFSTYFLASSPMVAWQPSCHTVRYKTKCFTPL